MVSNTIVYNLYNFFFYLILTNLFKFYNYCRLYIMMSIKLFTLYKRWGQTINMATRSTRECVCPNLPPWEEDRNPANRHGTSLPTRLGIPPVLEDEGEMKKYDDDDDDNSNNNNANINNDSNDNDNNSDDNDIKTTF